MQFAFDFPGTTWLYLTLALVLAVAATWLYFRETRRRVSTSSIRYLLPTLRGCAVFLVTLMLLEPVVRFRHVEGEPGRLLFVIDNSMSMQRVDVDGQSRLSAAHRTFLNSTGIPLDQLKSRFDIEVVHSDGQDLFPIWNSALRSLKESDVPKAIDGPPAYSSRTEFGELINNHPSESVILLTDGSLTGGRSLVEAAGDRPSEAPPLFFVPLGNFNGAAEPLLFGVTNPEQADRADSVSGEIRYQANKAVDATLKITFKDQVVWSKRKTADELQQNSAGTESYDFPIEKLVEEALKSEESTAIDMESRSIALEFEASISQPTEDSESRNNAIKFRVWVSLIRNRALLLECRPRWETRYIRNALDRDPRWEIQTLQLNESDDAQLQISKLFKDVDALSQFDLVLLSELPASLFPATAQNILEKYVAEAGGGLIILDGAFGYFREEGWNEMLDVMPIQYGDLAANDTDLLVPRQVIPSDAALKDVVFQIPSESGDTPLLDTWRSLPPLYVQSFVNPKPAATVMATANADGNKANLFVEQRLGAGMVFYSATDQTWKWRYKRADEVHRLFWMQVCRNYSRKPFLVRSETIDLDVSPRVYLPSESVLVRAHLNSERFADDPQRLVFAIVENQETQEKHRFLLDADRSMKGFYQATLDDLEPGHYRYYIETAGMSPLEQQVAADIYVADNDRQELISGVPDLAGMQNAAEKSGGGVFELQDLPQLVSRLEASASGRIIRSTLALWQSFWLFIPLICLLAVEWFLRKRSGML